MLRRQRPEGKPAPGPGALALLQGLRSFQKDPLEYVTRLQQKYGDLVRIRLGPQDIFLVTEPTLIEESCRSPSAFTRGTIARRAREVIGPSLIVSEGHEWKRHRRLMSLGFRSSFMANLRPAVDDAATEMTQRWVESGRKTVDVEAAARHYTLDSTCRALFGRALPTEADALGRALTDVLDLTVRRAREVLPLRLWVPTSRHRAFAERRRRADALIDDLLRGAQRHPPERCLASRLAHDAHVSGDMNPDQLRAETFGLLFSGYESPTRALTWTLSLLARHPEAQVQARASASKQVDGGVSPADDFLVATIKEAMRLYPPGWILGREASQDTVLGGYRIRKGAFLMYSAWVTHRRSDLWEAPLEFRPSRFLERERPAGTDFSYFPFGLPPNHCIGAGFALLQARAAIAKILMNFEIRALGAPPHPVAEATVRPSRPVVLSLRPLQKK